MEKVAAGTLLRQFLEKWTVTKEEFDLGHMIVHPNNLRLSHLDKVVKKGLSLKRCECIGIGIGSDGCYSVLCVLFGLLAYVGVKYATMRAPVPLPLTTSGRVDWWAHRLDQFPTLAPIAAAYLRFPRFSAQAERTFSLLGHTHGPTRGSFSFL